MEDCHLLTSAAFAVAYLGLKLHEFVLFHSHVFSCVFIVWYRGRKIVFVKA